MRGIMIHREARFGARRESGHTSRLRGQWAACLITILSLSKSSDVWEINVNARFNFGMRNLSSAKRVAIRPQGGVIHGD
jgi:hypothetical protein